MKIYTKYSDNENHFEVVHETCYSYLGRSVMCPHIEIAFSKSDEGERWFKTLEKAKQVSDIIKNLQKELSKY